MILRARTYAALNALRVARGRRPLVWDRALAALAHDRAEVALRTGTHAEAGSTDWPAGVRRRYASVAEANAYLGPAEGVSGATFDPVAAWRRSPEHRRLILAPRWTDCGIGIARSPTMIVVSLLVGRRIGS